MNVGVSINTHPEKECATRSIIQTLERLDTSAEIYLAVIVAERIRGGHILLRKDLSLTNDRKL